MGETVTNLPCLQQSVSFGRFEHDSLCWERWSTFPSNKYLEEVEKCSTPGSVAQKKAYFEAHYKKIASRRAELLADQERGADEQAKQEDSVDVSLVYDTSEDELVNKKADVVNSVDTTDRLDDEMGSIEGEVVVEHISVVDESAGEFNRENDVGGADGDVSVFSEENDLFELDLPGYMSDHIDFSQTVNDMNEARNLSSDECEDAVVFKDDGNVVIHEGSEAVSIEVTKNAGEVNSGADVDEVVNKEIIEVTFEPYDESNLIDGIDTRPYDECFSKDLRLDLEIRESIQLKESVSEMGNVPSIGEEPPQEMVKRTIDEEKSIKLITLASPKKLQKATPAKKTTSANNKSIPAQPIRRKTSALTPKSPMLSTPKSAKPELTKFSKSANGGILDKKGNGFTPCNSEKAVGSQSKRVVPTSMHTSLGSGPMNSDQVPLTKKSLIMESMGDKEIVKRAFKAFRTTPQMSPSSATKSSFGKSPAANQFTSRNAAPKGSRVITVSKKNEGIGRAAKIASTRTVLQVTKTPVSPRLKTNCGAGQRNVKSVAASFGPRVQLQGNNQKDASKKLESKPKSDSAQPHSKLKVEKDSQVGTRSQNVYSKPKRSPRSIHGYGGSLRKENVSSKTHA